MKCRKCGERAAINLKQHRLALCKPHYLDWIVDQTERVIVKYQMFSHQDRVLVAVSGGKDSLSLWDVLWRLGYQADGLYINLGIDEGILYSSQSSRFARQFAEERGLKLIEYNVLENTGETIAQTSKRTTRGHSRPCSVCGLVKRHVMNQVARDEGYQVLTTAHNLDDEVAVLFGNTLRWTMDMIHRQAPVLEEGEGLARKAKPFCRLYERDSAAYALLRGIPYIYDECPFATGSTSIYYKEILNQMENETPGTKLAFYTNFLRAREEGHFGASAHPSPAEEKRACLKCGQATTSATQVCSFCKLYEKK